MDTEDFIVLIAAGVGLVYLWPYIKPGSYTGTVVASGPIAAPTSSSTIASGGAQGVSAAGVAFVKQEEGFDATIKNDEGHQEIGYGHDFTGAPPYPPPITRAQADVLLNQDLAQAAGEIDQLVAVPLTQNQFDALASFQFNTGALAGSTLLQLLNAGNYAGAAQQFGRWIHAGGVVNQGLVARRAREAALFMTGATPTA